MKKVKQNQPKHHIGKSKDVVKVRRKKILKALIEGKTQEQAGIEAGLSPHTAQSQVSQILMNPNEKASFKELLDEVVPDGILVKKYHELMNSKKVISAMVIVSNGEGMKDANSMTRDFIEVDDCAV